MKEVPNLAFMFEKDREIQQVMYMRDPITKEVKGVQIVWTDGKELIISNSEGVSIMLRERDGSIQRYP